MRALLRRAEAARRDRCCAAPALVGGDAAAHGLERATRARDDLGAQSSSTPRACTPTSVGAARRRDVHDLPVPRRVRRASRRDARAGQRPGLSRCRTRPGTASACTSRGRPAARCCSGRPSQYQDEQGRLRARSAAARRFRRAGAALLPEVTLDDLTSGGQRHPAEAAPAGAERSRTS